MENNESTINRLRNLISKKNRIINELKKEIIEISEEDINNDKIVEENKMLWTQQKEFRTMAETAGSEVAFWKHKYLRMVDLYNKVKGEKK